MWPGSVVCSGGGVGLLATARSRVRLSAVPLSDDSCCSHTSATVTKQYNLLMVKRQLCFAAGKATVGPASHWHALQTYKAVYPDTGSMPI